MSAYMPCNACVRWKPYGGRGRCLNERSPHYRQPREGGFPACANLMRTEPEPPPKPEPRAEVVRRPAPEKAPRGWPKGKPRKVSDAEYAELLERNEARRAEA